MKRNPSGLTMLLLLGGAAGAGYYFWRRSQSKPAPGPQVHEPPAADQPPSSDEVAGGCYLTDKPRPERGYEWVCRNGLWKKRRTDRVSRTSPQATTLITTGGY